jgi:hypothetical protein
MCTLYIFTLKARKQKYFRYHITQGLINTIFICGKNLGILPKDNKVSMCGGGGSDEERRKPCSRGRIQSS